MDTLANALNTIKNNELMGKKECIVRPSSKLLKKVLDIFKKYDYIEGYEELPTEVANYKIIKVKLNGKINECKAIKPRLSVSYRDLQRYEERYIPSRDIGLLILSTSSGLLTHKEAKQLKKGGMLIAYVY